MYVVGVGQVCYHDVHIHSAIATLAAAAAATLTANQPRICPRMMASLFEIVHDCFRTHCHQYAKHTEKHMVFVCIWFVLLLVGVCPNGSNENLQYMYVYVYMRVLQFISQCHTPAQWPVEIHTNNMFSLSVLRIDVNACGNDHVHFRKLMPSFDNLCSG